MLPMSEKLGVNFSVYRCLYIKLTGRLPIYQKFSNLADFFYVCGGGIVIHINRNDIVIHISIVNGIVNIGF